MATHADVTDHARPEPLRGTGAALRDPFPWETFSRLASAAESAGYAGLFLPQIAGREVVAALSGLGRETTTIRLGTGVVPIVDRTAETAAMGAATVHELSGGRMILGLGTGPAGPGALERLRAYVDRVRSLLGAAASDVHGGSPVRIDLTVPVGPPPIWIAALGPRAMRLAGEIADGAILNWCPPERVAFATERMREGAERAGRDPAGVTIAVYVRAALGTDEAVAMPALRAMAGQYAAYSAYRRQFEAVGLGEEAAAADAAHRAGRPEEVPEALVRAVCLLGNERAARDRLEAFRAAGAHLPVVYPVAIPGEEQRSVERTLSALAPPAPS